MLYNVDPMHTALVSFIPPFPHLYPIMQFTIITASFLQILFFLLFSIFFIFLFSFSIFLYILSPFLYSYSTIFWFLFSYFSYSLFLFSSILFLSKALYACCEANFHENHPFITVKSFQLSTKWRPISLEQNWHPPSI